MKGTKRGFKGSSAPRCTEEMNSFTPFIAPNPPRHPLVTAWRKSFHVPVGFSSSYPIRCTLLFPSTPLRPSSRSFCRHQPVEDTSSPLEVLRPWNTHGNPTCHQSNAIRVFTFQHHILCLSLRDIIIEIRPCPWAQFYSNRGVGCRNK